MMPAAPPKHGRPALPGAWQAVGQDLYLERHPGFTPSGCLVIEQVRVRNGGTKPAKVPARGPLV